MTDDELFVVGMSVFVLYVKTVAKASWMLLFLCCD